MSFRRPNNRRAIKDRERESYLGSLPGDAPLPIEPVRMELPGSENVMQPRPLLIALVAGLVLGIALMLAGCGESEPAPQQKRTSLEDITNAAARLIKPKAVPAPQADPVPMPEPPPIAARPVEPTPQAAPTPIAKPKPKKEWQRKKATAKRASGVAGYSCATIRKAGSPAVVEAMASARGYTVSDSDSRKIQACFDQR